MIIKYLHLNSISAKILSGEFSPRTLLTPSDTAFPCTYKRLQITIILSFKRTMNKSQRLYLLELVFSHGMLYFALSRVKSKVQSRSLKRIYLDICWLMAGPKIKSSMKCRIRIYNCICIHSTFHTYSSLKKKK